MVVASTKFVTTKLGNVFALRNASLLRKESFALPRIKRLKMNVNFTSMSASCCWRARLPEYPTRTTQVLAKRCILAHQTSLMIFLLD